MQPLCPHTAVLCVNISVLLLPLLLTLAVCDTVLSMPLSPAPLQVALPHTPNAAWASSPFLVCHFFPAHECVYLRALSSL